MYLKNEELTYAKSNRRQNLRGELPKEIVTSAETYGVGIAVEESKFTDGKDVNSKFARVRHQFKYRKLLTMLESCCIRNGIEVRKIKPQFTGKIGIYKYCTQYGMLVHNEAANDKSLISASSIILN